ncbi:MAG: hypothetical protein KAS32_18940 [Candidatus Peribacteraceae bacterium]|nr:hypothetical protein [Candidatus Peribacteraceae bacterium]
MKFGDAIELMRQGVKVRRESWIPGVVMYLRQVGNPTTIRIENIVTGAIIENTHTIDVDDAFGENWEETYY